MAQDGDVDLAAQTSTFNLDDQPTLEGEYPGDSTLEALADLADLDDLAADRPLTEPEDGEAETENPESLLTEEDTDVAPAADDTAALLERVRAHRLVKGDLDLLSHLLEDRNTLEGTGPDVGSQVLAQKIEELERRLSGQQPPPASAPEPPPQTKADRIAAIQERYLREHGREAEGPEIVEALAEEAAERRVAALFEQQVAQTQQREMQRKLDAGLIDLQEKYPWATEDPRKLRNAALIMGQEEAEGNSISLVQAFEEVAGLEIARRAAQRNATARQKQAERAASTTAVEPGTEPGEPAPAEPGSFAEIREYNMRHFGG